jgi:hypothetical protein
MRNFRSSFALAQPLRRAPCEGSAPWPECLRQNNSSLFRKIAWVSTWVPHQPHQPPHHVQPCHPDGPVVGQQRGPCLGRTLAKSGKNKQARSASVILPRRDGSLTNAAGQQYLREPRPAANQAKKFSSTSRSGQSSYGPEQEERAQKGLLPRRAWLQNSHCIVSQAGARQSKPEQHRPEGLRAPPSERIEPLWR